MNKSIYYFKRKYAVQDELLNEGALDGLDERTLHETIKAMLFNTTKDCIKYENWMNPDMTEITKLLVKENKTEDDMHKIKNAQDRLRNMGYYNQDELQNTIGTLMSDTICDNEINAENSILHHKEGINLNIKNKKLNYKLVKSYG